MQNGWLTLGLGGVGGPKLGAGTAGSIPDPARTAAGEGGPECGQSQQAEKEAAAKCELQKAEHAGRWTS